VDPAFLSNTDPLFLLPVYDPDLTLTSYTGQKGPF
jgi:hypothetical protein